MRGDLFLRAALVALDEAGDPTHVRAGVEAARTRAAPIRHAARPAGRVKRVAWSAGRLAMFADDPARAYMALRELCTALFEPLSGAARAPAPAPEVALALEPVALLDALAPPPRVLARELAIASGLDSTALLADARFDRRVLGVRAIAAAKLGRFALALAPKIAADPEPIVRAEVLAICARASGPVRTRLATALAPYTEDPRDDVRAAALDGLRTLAQPLASARLAAKLADPSPAVRAAAARSVLPAAATELAAAVVACLDDPDARVQTAALEAIARCPALHRASTIAPLLAFAQRHDGDTRAALYLLGKLHRVAPDPTAIVAALHTAVAGPRSDVARAAMLVLRQLGAPIPEVPVEARLLRAARELAAPDHDTQRAGLFEASHLGDAGRPLIPALRRLADALVAAGDPEARATLAQVADVLSQLGVPPAELPRPRPSLAPYRGITPRERTIHGAYAIASVDAPTRSALGVWDHATGALLFVVEHAELLDFLPGRAEVGALRVDGDAWCFERHAVPAGTRLASLAIPARLSRGWPSRLAAAADLVTIYCGDRDEPYRFHIKLDVPDRLLDDGDGVY